jgi:SAM-dependent methyltransferase
MDLYNDTYKLFCNLIEKKNARIFEIGCGPGNITKYLLTQRPDFKMSAIDFAPTMVELARELNPLAQFEVMDCREIAKIESHYDAIICGFCAPYLTKMECIKLIQDAAVLLKQDGIFYISCIEGNYPDSKMEQSSDGQFNMMVYVHEESYLVDALKESKFELLKIFKKEYTKSDGKISIHLILLAKRNKD